MYFQLPWNFTTRCQWWPIRCASYCVVQRSPSSIRWAPELPRYHRFPQASMTGHVFEKRSHPTWCWRRLCLSHLLWLRSGKSLWHAAGRNHGLLRSCHWLSIWPRPLRPRAYSRACRTCPRQSGTWHWWPRWTGSPESGSFREASSRCLCRWGCCKR